jgi:hypothetical protein
MTARVVGFPKNVTYRNSEEWLSVVGFEGLYEVSNIGRVRSVARIVARSNGSPCSVKERFLKQRRHKNGYLMVTIYKSGQPHDRCVHSLMAEAFIGRRPDGKEVAHEDGDPSHNEIGNLSYKTPRGNMEDRMRHGTIPRGEKHWQCKLTELQVLAIRNGSGKPSAVAAEFGVSESMIRRIRKGIAWKWLQEGVCQQS